MTKHALHNLVLILLNTFVTGQYSQCFQCYQNAIMCLTPGVYNLLLLPAALLLFI